MDRLPDNSAAVVAIGPYSLPMAKGSRSVLVAVDLNGNEVGRIEGEGIYWTPALAHDRSVITASAREVTVLTENGSLRQTIDENMVEGVARDPVAGRSTLWFNTGRPDGPNVPYRNNYVLAGPNSAFETGFIPGTVLTVAQCGDKSYGIASDFEKVGPGGRDTVFKLYVIRWGAPPELRNQWQQDRDYFAMTRESACAPDGKSIFSLFSSDREHPKELVRIDTASGQQTVIPVDFLGSADRVAENTLRLIGDRLYWVEESSGEVMSVSVEGAGSREVRREWRITNFERNSIGNTQDRTVAVLARNGDDSSLTLYDLTTGRVMKGPIEIPWLNRLRQDIGGVVTGVAVLADKPTSADTT